MKRDRAETSLENSMGEFTTHEEAESGLEAIQQSKKQRIDDAAGTNRNVEQTISNRLQMPSADKLLSTMQEDRDSKAAEIFQERASMLMNECVLCLGDGTFCRLGEIEFYLCDVKRLEEYRKEKLEPFHYDIFCHQCTIQVKNAKWYFHKAGQNYETSKFKAASYRGLDITFGNDDFFAGILIRSIMTDKLQFVEGPAKVVEYILKQNNSSSIEHFITHILQGNLSIECNDEINPSNQSATTSKEGQSKSRFGLKYKSDLLKENSSESKRIENLFQNTELITSGRVGLTLKKIVSKKSAKGKKKGKANNDEGDDGKDDGHTADDCNYDDSCINKVLEPFFLKYVLADYRYLAYTSKMTKGKWYIVSSLYAKQKKSHPNISIKEHIQMIQKKTSYSSNTISNWVSSFDAGFKSKNAKKFYGKQLSNSDICELCGALCALQHEKK